MTESMESREYVASWLRQVPEFMAELGIRGGPHLASRLQYLGSGASADVVYLGERDGTKRVLKVTGDEAQAAMSMAALEDRPPGVVTVFDVVETDIAPRSALPDLPKKGEAPVQRQLTWGIVEKLAVPFGNLRQLGSTRVAGFSPDDLIRRAAAAWGAYDAGRPVEDPLVENWRQLYAAALAWIGETCEQVGSRPLLDMHEDNWGVDPDTGDLLLLDLGQCYQPKTKPGAVIATLEQINAAPVGSLVVTLDGFSAWRREAPGKAGWSRQRPVDYRDGWARTSPPQTGMREFPKITRAVAGGLRLLEP